MWCVYGRFNKLGTISNLRLMIFISGARVARGKFYWNLNKCIWTFQLEAKENQYDIRILWFTFSHMFSRNKGKRKSLHINVSRTRTTKIKSHFMHALSDFPYHTMKRRNKKLISMRFDSTLCNIIIHGGNPFTLCFVGKKKFSHARICLLVWRSRSLFYFSWLCDENEQKITPNESHPTKWKYNTFSTVARFTEFTCLRDSACAASFFALSCCCM